MKKILGIDNGLSGALAFYDGAELLIRDMPVFEGDRKTLDMQGLKAALLENRPDHVFIEKLTPLPKKSGLAAFSMGHSEGVVLGMLAAYNLPFTLVRPAMWKKAMGCPKDKDAARKRASELLPQFAHNWNLKKHDGRAESSLIALYGYGLICK